MKTQNMIEMFETATPVLEALSTLFVFLIGLLVLFIIIVFIFDISQRKNAVLRNYPVVGHFRSIFSSLGEFFRQYFFAMDREEMPFNRAERDWVHRAANNTDTTIGRVSDASSSSVGKGQLAKITVPTGLRFLVDPNATVVSVLLAALCTQSRSARLNGISSLSIAKKYWRKNSPTKHDRDV
jgi:hypothetical protein